MKNRKASFVDLMDEQYIMSCCVELVSAVQVAIAEGSVVEGGYSDALYAACLFMGETNSKMLDIIDSLVKQERK